MGMSGTSFGKNIFQKASNMLTRGYAKTRNARYGISRGFNRHPVGAALATPVALGTAFGLMRGDITGGILGSYVGGAIGAGLGAAGGLMLANTGNSALKVASLAQAKAAVKTVWPAGKALALRAGMAGMYSGMLLGAFLGSNEPLNSIQGLYR